VHGAFNAAGVEEQSPSMKGVWSIPVGSFFAALG
jgi:hypothetical protein